MNAVPKINNRRPYMEVLKRIYIHTISMGGIPSEPQEVEGRDWKKIDLPENTEAFYFFDQAVIIEKINGYEFEWYSTYENTSPWHYVNARLLTLEEFELEFADNPHIDAMAEQLKEQGIETIIVTASGHPTPYEEGDILVELEDN